MAVPPRLDFEMLDINLSDCSFLTDMAVQQLSLTCTNLKVLALSFCCALTPEAIASLAENCPDLTSLDVSYCGSAVTDDSLLFIASKLLNLEKLSVRGKCLYLMLSGCGLVTDKGLENLESSLSLRILNISQCQSVGKKTTINDCILIRMKAGFAL